MMKKSLNLPVIRFRWALIGVAILFLGRLVFTLLIREQEVLNVVSNLYRFVEDIAVVTALFYTTRHVASSNPQLARAWTFLTIGILCVFVADVIWAALVLIVHEPPTPSLADVFYVAFYGFVWLTLFVYPLSPQRGSEHKYIWLDNIIVILGSGLLFWVFLIGPLLNARLGDFSQVTIAMIYPVFDLIMLCSLLTFFRNRPEQSNFPPLLLIGLGLLILLTSDCLFSYQQMLGTNIFGNYVDISVSCGLLITVLAGFAQVTALNHPPLSPKKTAASKTSRQTWPVYLPYFWMLVACALLIVKGTSPAQAPEEYVTVGTIIILVVLRQVLTLRDNETLFNKAQIELNERVLAQAALCQAHDELEARVRERTRDLLEANQELLVQIGERERAEKTLRYRAETDKRLAIISTNFMNTTSAEVDFEINRTLAILGDFAEVDRCYLIQFSPDGSTFSSTHEWTAPGVQPHIQNLQNIPASAAPWWMETLRRGEIIHIPSVANMPAEASLEKAVLLEQDIPSLVVVPLISEHNTIGFLGFDGARQKKEFIADEISLLKTIAAILSNALRRSHLQSELQEHVQQVEESLEEKNVLLKEIHHRVKNNLQIVSSLLSMQARTIKDPQAFAALQNSQSRVRSMALIHERLYQSENLGHIKFGPYIHDLSAFLFRSYQDLSGQVRLNTRIEDVTLDIDSAIPLGLILNELITNSLKYAFPGGRTGEITIQLLYPTAGQLNLICSDNGVGISPGQDLHAPQSLGMQLIYSLAHQLDGEVEIETLNGMRVSILIPIKAESTPIKSSQKNR
jgi:two-component system, sensor histidine kinase PdtaS